MNQYQYFLLRKEGSVAVLTLNRPEKANAIHREVIRELGRAIEELEGMDDLRAVILNGAGNHFSAGIDLSYLQTHVDSAGVCNSLPVSQAIFTKLENLSVPVIAAIQGACIGAGCELSLACDIRVVATNARISLPEVKFGMAPDLGGITRLTKLVGPGLAKRLIFSAEEIGAEEAKAIGLAEIVAGVEEIQDKAMELGRKIARNAPLAVMMAKKGINVAAESSQMASLLFEQAQSIYCCGTEDKQEAARAYVEKRTPVFKWK